MKKKNDISLVAVGYMTKFFLKVTAGHLRSKQVNEYLKPFLLEVEDTLKGEGPGPSLVRKAVDEAMFEFLMEEVPDKNQDAFREKFTDSYKSITGSEPVAFRKVFLDCTSEVYRILKNR
ncbi:hypothetical protein CN918_25705 [Priestia megaterium]|nr:hypothetical protein CN918_25705 [Priestia megaterium]